jgi:hypothetical protein
MNKKTINFPAIFFAGLSIALTLSLAYVVKENHWAMTHRADVQQLQELRNEHERQFKIEALGKVE